MYKQPLLNFKNLLFKLIVLLLPTQLAFHFWPEWSIVQGLRIDYFSPKLYLIDFFVILYLVIHFLTSSENKNFSKFFIVSLFLIFINLFFSLSFINSTIYIFRLLTYFSFSFIAINSGVNFYEDFIKPLTLSLILVCIISIVQFFLQKNIGGVLYFFGERPFSNYFVGVPKFIFFGREYLRVYGTFSHPNSLAGFLIVGGTLLLFKDFDKKDKYLKSLFYIFLPGALLFSFSEGSFLTGLIVLVVYVLWKARKRINTKWFKLVPIILLVLSILFSIASSNLVKRGGRYTESVSLRISLAAASEEMIVKRFWSGVGANNFILELSKKPPIINSVLFLQPVHNIYLLIFSEWGMVGVIIFIVLTYKALTNTQNLSLKVALVSILLLGIFDHYSLTLNQNLFLFVLIISFALWERKAVYKS